MSTRDIAIDIYRIALMLGICSIHAISFGPNKCVFAENVLLSCVVGFVFISGWFSVNFSWRKALGLCGTGLYCSALVYVGLRLHGDTTASAFRGVIGAFHDQWFLFAYLLMTFLSPLVNAAIRGERDDLKALVPLLALSWGWGFALTLPYVPRFLPKTNGLEAYGGITLTAAYAAARYCRLHRLFDGIRMRTLLLALPVLVFLTGIGFGDYNSPFAFVLAAVMFELFRRAFGGVTAKSLAGRAALVLAPSMFAVYLLHSAALGRTWIPRLEGALAEGLGLPGLATVPIAAGIVFASCLLLDLPRRIFQRLKKRYG